MTRYALTTVVVQDLSHGGIIVATQAARNFIFVRYLKISTEVIYEPIPIGPAPLDVFFETYGKSFSPNFFKYLRTGDILHNEPRALEVVL